MFELGVAIRVRVAFARLAIGLQAELLSVQQVTDSGASDLVAHGHQRARQLRQTFAGPAQRRHRIAARVRLHHRQQISQQRWVLGHQRPVAATWPADTVGSELVRRGQLGQASPYRACRDAGRPRHSSNATIPGRAGF
jgi:hypothetical protein